MIDDMWEGLAERIDHGSDTRWRTFKGADAAIIRLDDDAVLVFTRRYKFANNQPERRLSLVWSGKRILLLDRRYGPTTLVGEYNDMVEVRLRGFY